MNEVSTSTVQGTCASEFQPVADALERNFKDRGEVGAAVCVYQDGTKVVDLWGGPRNAAGEPWRADTLVNMMSVTKSVVALCAHSLVEDGVLSLAAPDADYWPAFAQAGKAEITVQQLISHHAALIYADAAPEASMFDWDAVIGALELQTPEWPPGTRGAYHSSTYGYLIAELIRRASGRSVREVLEQRFTTPLGIEFYIGGLTEEQIQRTADIITNPKSASLQAFSDRSTKLGRASILRVLGPGSYNTRQFRQGFAPSSNGHSNARSVARLYAMLALGGEIDGERVLKEETVRRLRTEQWDNICGLTDRPFRMGMGVFLHRPPLLPFGRNPEAFGHPGVGGAIGFADPALRLSFSYSPNFMCEGAGVGDRGEALIAATYTCV